MVTSKSYRNKVNKLRRLKSQVDKTQKGWGKAGENRYLYEGFELIRNKLTEMIRLMEE